MKEQKQPLFLGAVGVLYAYSACAKAHPTRPVSAYGPLVNSGQAGTFGYFAVMLFSFLANLDFILDAVFLCIVEVAATWSILFFSALY